MSVIKVFTFILFYSFALTGFSQTTGMYYHLGAGATGASTKNNTVTGLYKNEALSEFRSKVLAQELAPEPEAKDIAGLRPTSIEQIQIFPSTVNNYFSFDAGFGEERVVEKYWITDSSGNIIASENVTKSGLVIVPMVEHSGIYFLNIQGFGKHRNKHRIIQINKQ